MILVEGLDNTGKTTLVEELTKRHQGLVPRPSIGNKHDLQVIREGAAYEAEETSRWVISDRSRLISEWVYQPILKNREVAYSFSDWMNMLSRFVQHDHLVIHCWRNTETKVFMNTFHNSPQLRGVKSHLPQLAARYQRMMEMLNLLFTLNGQDRRVVYYNFDHANTELAYTAVARYLKGE